MVKILVDEDLPKSTSEVLRSLGVDAVDVRDVGLRGSTDVGIFEYAQGERRIILTRDKEFGSPLKYPRDTHPGAVIVRVPNTYVRDEILAVIKKFFVEVGERDLRNTLVVLEVDKYRIRQLVSLAETQMT